MLYHLQVRNLHTLVSVLILALRSRRQIWRRVSQHMHHFRHTSREIFSQTILFLSFLLLWYHLLEPCFGYYHLNQAESQSECYDRNWHLWVYPFWRSRKSRPETRERIISSPIHLDLVFLSSLLRGQERFVLNHTDATIGVLYVVSTMYSRGYYLDRVCLSVCWIVTSCLLRERSSFYVRDSTRTTKNVPPSDQSYPMILRKSSYTHHNATNHFDSSFDRENGDEESSESSFSDFSAEFSRFFKDSPKGCCQ